MHPQRFLLPVALLLTACSHPEAVSRRNSPTQFARSIELGGTRRDSRLASAPSRPAAEVPPGQTAPDTSAAVLVDDRLRARRDAVVERIENLSTEDADAVCLRLELVPRERIFDRSVRPRKVLLRHAGQITSPDALESIERALNDLRR